jgi:hypothetical protein
MTKDYSTKCWAIGMSREKKSPPISDELRLEKFSTLPTSSDFSQIDGGEFFKRKAGRATEQGASVT